MKTYVINPRVGQSGSKHITVGKAYEILGEISGYNNVIFEDPKAVHCQYEETVVVVYDAHELSNRQAWWVKHLIDVECVKVIVVGDTSNI